MSPGVSFPPAQSEIKNLFQPLDIFALLMASIGHDVGHPGVNNSFMVPQTHFFLHYSALTEFLLFLLDHYFSTISHSLQ